jgi:hypothetical protein
MLRKNEQEGNSFSATKTGKRKIKTGKKIIKKTLGMANEVLMLAGKTTGKTKLDQNTMLRQQAWALRKKTKLGKDETLKNLDSKMEQEPRNCSATWGFTNWDPAAQGEHLHGDRWSPRRDRARFEDKAQARFLHDDHEQEKSEQVTTTESNEGKQNKQREPRR